MGKAVKVDLLLCGHSWGFDAFKLLDLLWGLNSFCILPVYLVKPDDWGAHIDDRSFSLTAAFAISFSW